MLHGPDDSMPEWIGPYRILERLGDLEAAGLPVEDHGQAAPWTEDRRTRLGEPVHGGALGRRRRSPHAAGGTRSDRERFP